MPRLCLMQVHAHPDDEASKGAATAARYAAEGVRTVLVTCTGGEAGEILNPAADTPEARADLPAVRRAELDESAAILGYAAVRLLGYRDSGMPGTEANAHPAAFANAPLEEAVGRLVEVVRAERPHVILCYSDDQSRYPHPDHLRAHDVAVAAFDAAADAARFPGEPWQPLKLYYMGRALRVMQAYHEAILAGGEPSPLEPFLGGVGDDDRFTTAVDVAEHMAARDRALLAHRTQVAPDSAWFALPLEERIRIAPTEQFIRARSLVEVPGGIERDLFTGIR
ncbi:MAG TPA: mycothiol conjugate amidase Mca [Actinomycetota bacterium]